jgi:virginiamycin A acetyltransferase
MSLIIEIKEGMIEMMGPDPNAKYPIPGNRNLQFIKNVITKPNIIAGEYSYYDAANGESFEDQVLYHYEVIGTKLIIGKFCSIAPEVRFMMDVWVDAAASNITSAL